MKEKIFACGHVTEVYGPIQALFNFLLHNFETFGYLFNPFPYSKIKESKYVEKTINGMHERAIFNYFKNIEVFTYIEHLFLTFYFAFCFFRKNGKINIFIGGNNLHCVVGIILKKIGIVDKVVYYVIDYTPQRFENKIMNFLYHFLDKFCVKHSDYVWCVSNRIAEVKSKFANNKQKIKVVPIGIELRKIKLENIKKRRKNVIVFVSHLDKSKGIQLAIEAMKDVIKVYPNVKLEIIGTGPYEEELKKFTEKLELSDHVTFLGVMNHDELMNYLPTCGIALATYVDDPTNITYYADPTKPKEYLACGVPVIITKVPWIAEEIERKPMGIAINYDKEELANAIIKLLTDSEFYNICVENALEFTKDLDWNKIFEKAFKSLG